MGDIKFPHLGLEFNVGNGFTIFGIEIAFYGIIIALGMIIAAVVCFEYIKKIGQDVNLYMDYFIFGVIGAIIGARIYYVIFEWDFYSRFPEEILNLRGGGLAIYGAIIGAVLVLLIFCKIKKTKPLQMLDVIVIGLLIGQIIGRWGNFFNREAYGGYTDCLFAMQIPVKDAAVVTKDLVVATDSGFYVQVHPTFLYESFLNSVVLTLMLVFRKTLKFEGENLCRYLLGYGVIRFFIEGMRTDQLQFKGVAVSQVLSAVLAVGALVTIVVVRVMIWKKEKKTAENI